ncbi:hypothetical protein [Enterococcus faecium]|uniref:hypothetical protein n=1 Tax=Enterococcus faecium TaxID=1352 RepID=UPI00191373BF|nr:hypothetical protein [Enterococcus faecium]MBK5028792.1 hypothetical protein [Enterococcus faecium]MBK5039495.1 hypothetical protein [Enterococcus faecium]MBK5044373.1 hypothetical protein [Enterococcus faecium]MBK5069375.1 hypothetical protein [Enterococcus faecium]MBK5132588.1 hypothetical protein [Enterococcus faecium]
MKQYLNQWNIIEGALTEERINEIPDCLEKDHLFLIRRMLQKENFEPNNFIVVEYPATGIYCCNHINNGQYFIIQEEKNKLVPYYTTCDMNEEGINNFPCTSIKESMKLIEM